ncbi:hypothetical protein ANOM_000456 [Aspergillus nomiae NRRL 13137]|uniref:Azaphilone pigments biosynthesis cluster protein L N-terminal domain-containing protein n=1 Tax=Aspergillus nomiae NRRL (strain ATCC 15546 / NRRL 13137 / CBS 260.88 / M93) TaxID=1509407 RepID=A0A0L1JHZ1_ASPN3|nr:uncharacterized protein ANOM_000456 [Aspergillus nomiae NRRL 13137]KNG91327.1 hypothetical protein ANOM_000456 [Aspergillus nomiae NRRL 13137]
MAETLGLALALITFTAQSTKALYETLQSFRSHSKRVQRLLEELEDLSRVLGPLSEIVHGKVAVDLSALEIPLQRCGNACKDFQQILLQCSSQSGSDRTSFRGWAKLTYMGDDIDGFRQLLSSYKLTMNIALTDVTLRRSTVTAERLEAFRKLIEEAKDGLEVRLERIDGKLEQIFERSVSVPGPDASEMELIKEERFSTERCIQICSKLSDHIDQIQPTIKSSECPSKLVNTGVLCERITDERLLSCRNGLAETTKTLEKRRQYLIRQLIAKCKSAVDSEEEELELTRLQDEWEAARQCMGIWSRADHNLKENISVIENHATGGDAWQYMLSTTGQILHGRNEGHGGQIRQMGGHMSEEAVMQLSRDWVRMADMNERLTKNADAIQQSDATSVELKPTLS